MFFHDPYNRYEMIDCLKNKVKSVDIADDALQMMLDIIYNYIDKHHVDASTFLKEESDGVAVYAECLPYNLLCLLFKFFMTLSAFPCCEIQGFERHA
jgi:hypothetical protein